MNNKNAAVSKHLDCIRSALLGLEATGPAGFEGLLKVVLTELVQAPFRLAASGLQGGLDGRTVDSSNDIAFEAKRYSGKIPRSEVISKIADFARNNNSPDRLWVLGATTEVSAQLAADIKHDGDQNNVSTLILDWIEQPLPLLAVATVAAGSTAIDFLLTHSNFVSRQAKGSRRALVIGFKSIAEHPAYHLLLNKLRSSFVTSELAITKATDANKIWREAAFKDPSVARTYLGQALAISSLSDVEINRSALREKLTENFNTEKCAVLFGDEGQGKSWLAAQVCREHNGIALFASAERFADINERDFREFLVDLLVEQTGGYSNIETIKRRWHHRLKAWQDRSPISRVLVVVDGVNQRQKIGWDRLLNSLYYLLKEIGGLLVITTRPKYWKDCVSQGLDFSPKLVEVPKWTPSERDELLQRRGIKIEWLDEATLKTLENPRLLGVAVETLPLADKSVWVGLTPKRILFEHLRASQREAFEVETYKDLTNRISDHARHVLENLIDSQTRLPHGFVDESGAVIETRFFVPTEGPSNTYSLRDEGLTLALGYALVDRLWQAKNLNKNIAELTTRLIDPIHAIDISADVVLAALLVCALDDIRFESSIFSNLLDAFSSLQNTGEKRFDELFEIVKHKPIELFDSIARISLGGCVSLNEDWLIHAAFEVGRSEAGWQTMKLAIHNWLRYYNKDAAAQVFRRVFSSDSEYTNEVQTIQEEIQGVLQRLSVFEEDLLSQMTEVAGALDKLFSLALKFLAGRELAPFAESFVAMGLSFGIDRHIHSARRAFEQLTTFNRIDREEAKVAFLKAIEPLMLHKSSMAGQWTIVRMQHASNDLSAINSAVSMAKKLRKNNSQLELPSPNQWRQTKAADLNAERPVDFAEGVARFRAIETARLLQHMGQTAEDYDYRQLLALACRFEPELAIEKASKLIAEFETRGGLALRQLTFNGEDHRPLMLRKTATRLKNRAKNNDLFSPLPIHDCVVLKQFLYVYVIQHLTASEQLHCLINETFGPNLPLDVIPNLKPQKSDAVVKALREALESDNEGVIFGVLAALLANPKIANAALEVELLKCLESKSQLVKTMCLQVATTIDSASIRRAFIESNWTQKTVKGDLLESWFGSALLISACKNQEITIQELLARMSSDAWFEAAKHLGHVIVEPLALSLIQKLRAAKIVIGELLPPTFDLSISNSAYPSYPPYTKAESSDESNGVTLKMLFSDASKIDDHFYLEQKKLNALATRFFEQLFNSEANLFVQQITLDDLKRLVSVSPSLLEDIVVLVEQATSVEFPWLRNIALAAANLVSTREPQRAAALFVRASEAIGVITQALGDKLTSEHYAIWSSGDSLELRHLWRNRLLTSSNDAVLALEVLAAERFGALEFIRMYVSELHQSDSTLDQAYAVRIAGYSSQFAYMSAYFEKQSYLLGMLGEAARNSKAAFDSAQWADEWVRKMWRAKTVTEFWRYLIIASTAIDARVSVQPPKKSKWVRFASVFRIVRAKSINDEDRKREKLLFGCDAPARIFITGGAPTEPKS